MQEAHYAYQKPWNSKNLGILVSRVLIGYQRPFEVAASYLLIASGYLKRSLTTNQNKIPKFLASKVFDAGSTVFVFT